MLVKHYRGLKEKYKYNELDKQHEGGIYFAKDTKEILMDGVSYGSSDSKTTEAITVLGGPLSDDASDNWPAEWKVGNDKVIPANTSLQDILTGLFFKTIEGTVTLGGETWSPKIGAPSITLDKSGTVEVGTKINATVTPNTTITGNTRTRTFTTTQGYFLDSSINEETGKPNGIWYSGNKTVTALLDSIEGKTSTGTVTIDNTEYHTGAYDANINTTVTWNGTTITDYSNLSVKSGTNTLNVTLIGPNVYVGDFDDITLYASTNTKMVLPNKKAEIVNDVAPSEKLLSTTNKATITGYYRWNAFATDSIDITKTESSWQFTNSKTVSSVTAADQQYIVVLVPSGFTLKTASQMGLDFTGSFDSKDVTLTIGGGSDTYAYKMYYWPNTSGSNATVDNITIS